MPEYFLILVIILFALAITDLVVGVSNDAVNFLNSAIGSKVASWRTIMIVAAIGIFIGATFSSGMMEVARKGIFNPEHFYFREIMVIFLAVMLTDIILLDLFNTFGLPTSTTVSIVFELLGAAVVVSLIKLAHGGEGTLADYINSSKALAIIGGILLSVVVAFGVGTLIQYLSRLIFSFQYEKRMKYVGALWSGLALSAMTYFLIIKGMKGASFVTENMLGWIQSHTWTILIGSFVIWTVLLQLLYSIFKVNILKVVVLFGTFSLAMAFAGNDLVNFIGVPIAGLESFLHWKESGIPADQYGMEILHEPVRTKTWLLLVAGTVMVLALWFSRKARTVTETSVELGRQDETQERFEPNAISRGIVRVARGIGQGMIALVPPSWVNRMEANFEVLRLNPASGKELDPPAFDLVRASVSLAVASMLISLATSMKLPLSTTYVTFMVAMGASLADRAWGRDSAVYRVAGVLSVIAGWFFTAFVAFTAAGLFALIIYFFGPWGIGLLVLLAFGLIIRSTVYHNRKEAEKEDSIRTEKSQTTLHAASVEADTAKKVAGTLKTIKLAYANSLNGLLAEDMDMIKLARADVKRLESQTEKLRNKLFGYISRIQEDNSRASRLYLLIFDLDQDILQSTRFIVKACVTHVSNSHNPLAEFQATKLEEVRDSVSVFLDEILDILDKKEYERYEFLKDHRRNLLDKLEELLAHQTDGIRAGKYNSRNSLLFFSLLLETKDLVVNAARFIKLYYRLQRAGESRLLLMEEE
jgi:phosphate/sulfate permease